MTDQNGLVPVEDLAKYLKVSVWTVRAWVKQGTIPPDCYVKAGKAGHYRFDVAKTIEAMRASNSDHIESVASTKVKSEGDSE